MIIHRFPIGQLSANCYFVVCQKSNEGIIIDPGDDGDFLTQKILQLQIKPLYIVLTHGHFDHILAAEELRLNFKIPLMIHRDDFFLTKKAHQSADYFGIKGEILIPKEVKFIKEGEKIKFGQETIAVIHTPGHTPGSISLYSKKENILFCGDLLFENGFGRTDFSYGSAEKLNNSLKKIFSLPPQTLVYPGHGEKFFLEEVVKYGQR